MQEEQLLQTNEGQGPESDGPINSKTQSVIVNLLAFLYTMVLPVVASFYLYKLTIFLQKRFLPGGSTFFHADANALGVAFIFFAIGLMFILLLSLSRMEKRWFPGEYWRSVKKHREKGTTDYETYIRRFRWLGSLALIFLFGVFFFTIGFFFSYIRLEGNSIIISRWSLLPREETVYPLEELVQIKKELTIDEDRDETFYYRFIFSDGESVRFDDRNTGGYDIENFVEETQRRKTGIQVSAGKTHTRSSKNQWIVNAIMFAIMFATLQWLGLLKRKKKE